MNSILMITQKMPTAWRVLLLFSCLSCLPQWLILRSKALASSSETGPET